MRHLLVGIDGSQSARKAALYAHDLAQQIGARVTLLFVLDPPRVFPIGPLDSVAIAAHPPPPEEMQRVTQLLDEVAKDLPRAQLEKRVVVGAPAATLLEQARELAADTIVVGARGLGPGGRWLLGSVSDRVVHHADRPVIVVH
ncbi:MAG: universal stress protein [Myxococcota bacterium]